METYWRILELFLRGVVIGIILGTASAFLVRYHARADVNKTVVAIVQESQRHGIDPLLVAAIIKVESNWNVNAIGSSGEVGLMQLLPKYHTAESDPVKNVKEGISYLAYLRKNCPSKDAWIVCFNNGVSRNPKHPKLNVYYKKVIREYETLKSQARSIKLHYSRRLDRTVN